MAYKILITIPDHLKDKIINKASKEERSISNFLVNCAVEYMKPKNKKQD